MSGHQIETSNHVWEAQGRQVHYLSLEFLMGRSLEKNAYNLGLLDTLTQVLEDLGFSAADLFETEPDAGLGNGGLGRLAACYLDSMTTLEIPATGYSICYELGIFKQKIIDGKQVELADNWLGLGDAWLIAKMDEAEEVRFGGKVEDEWDALGRHRVKQHRAMIVVLAVPRDMEIAGYQTKHTNTLRLWDAKSPVPVDMSLYSRGEYLKAVEQQAMAEAISKVLYPEDNHYEGKSLRLKQQYFFVSATIQSIVRKHRAEYGTLRNFHQACHPDQRHPPHPGHPGADAHPAGRGGVRLGRGVVHRHPHRRLHQPHRPGGGAGALAPGLDREPSAPGLADPEGNRPPLPAPAGGALPRRPWTKVSPMAIIWGGEVRMANLCVCACYKINGVSALHSDILKRDVFHDAYLRTPDKFTNVTNGIDHRRWLSQINPKLDALVRECTGSDAYLLHPNPSPAWRSTRTTPPSWTAWSPSNRRTNAVLPAMWPGSPGDAEHRRHLRRTGQAPPRV